MSRAIMKILALLGGGTIFIFAAWAMVGLTAYEYWGLDINEWMGVPNAEQFVYRYFYIPLNWIALIALSSLLRSMIPRKRADS